MKKHYFTLIKFFVCLGFSIISINLYAFTIEDVTFDSKLGVKASFFDLEAPMGQNYLANDEYGPQRKHQYTLFFEQEISYFWANDKASFLLHPYVQITRYQEAWRLKQNGTLVFPFPIPTFEFGELRKINLWHADIREFLLGYASKSNFFEFRIGIGQVFWGAAESNHLIDVINQRDLLVSIDGESKLGQPMVNINLNLGLFGLELYALPAFRERKFQPDIGRLRPTFPDPLPNRNDRYITINDDIDPIYESEEKERHLDYAARISQSFSFLDIGFHAFKGTDREPFFNLDPSSGYTILNDEINSYLFTPIYVQMEQVGFDLQLILGSLLFKAEGLHKIRDEAWVSEDHSDYKAAVAGFEYTMTGFTGGISDLGIIVEYNWDSREEKALTTLQDDTFVGFRYNSNSMYETSVLIGVAKDREYESYSAKIEASKRMKNNRIWRIELYNFEADENVKTDFMHAFARDDYLKLSVEQYF